MLRALIALLFFPTVTGPSLPGDILALLVAARAQVHTKSKLIRDSKCISHLKLSGHISLLVHGIWNQIDDKW